MKNKKLLIVPVLFLSICAFIMRNVVPLQPAYSDNLPSASGIQTILSSSWSTYAHTFIQNGKVVRLDQGGDTVSEGQGYAMLRAVYMNDRNTFDSVWNWTNQNLSRMNAPDAKEQDHLFAWDYNGHVLDWSSATDADEDIAISLIFAGSKWNSGTYTSDARAILSDMAKRDTTLASNGKRYITGGSYGIYQQNPDIDPSYLSPAYYKVFAAVTNDPTWNQIADTSYEILQKSVSGSLATSAGLFPNWVLFDPSNQSVSAENKPDRNTDYTYDAFRTPFRVALDALWFKDNRASNLLANMNGFFSQALQTNGKIFAEYYHNGTVKGSYESSAIYGGDIGTFVADNNVSLTDLIETKILGDYHNGYFGSNTSYYGNNWAWFGLLLGNNEATNLYTGNQAVQPSSAQMSNGSVGHVSLTKSYTISFSLNTTSLPANYLVDIEIKDQNNVKVGQIFQNMSSHDAQTNVQADWQIANTIPSGKYTVDVGIFSTDWKSEYSWISDIGSISLS